MVNNFHANLVGLTQTWDAAPSCNGMAAYQLGNSTNLSQPNLPSDQMDHYEQCLRSGYLYRGPFFSRGFESSISIWSSCSILEVPGSKKKIGTPCVAFSRRKLNMRSHNPQAFFSHIKRSMSIYHSIMQRANSLTKRVRKYIYFSNS